MAGSTAAVVAGIDGSAEAGEAARLGALEARWRQAPQPAAAAVTPEAAGS